MFYKIDAWINLNNQHLNIFFGLAIFLTVVGCLLFVNFSQKMGPINEDSNTILLLVFRSMYILLLVLLSLLIIFAPRGLVYFREYLLFIVTISIFYGGLSTAYYYFKFFRD